tara:strand:+ start:572 stop:802 length:231 start_codon:yes stop_codon:yes gene_type:complete
MKADFIIMVDFVVRDAAMYFFNSDLSFHSGKSGPETEVCAIPERKVTVVRSMDVEFSGSGSEFSFIMICSSDEQKD